MVTCGIGTHVRTRVSGMTSTWTDVREVVTCGIGLQEWLQALSGMVLAVLGSRLFEPNSFSTKRQVILQFCVLSGLNRIGCFQSAATTFLKQTATTNIRNNGPNVVILHPEKPSALPSRGPSIFRGTFFPV